MKASKQTTKPLNSVEDIKSIKDAAYRVLRMPCVADKTFLISIGDRSVGGMTARDQFVGRAAIDDGARPHDQHVARHALDLRHIALANLAESFQQRDHLTFPSQAVEHTLAVAARRDQGGPPQDLQVPRGVGERQRGPCGQLLHAALALAQVL